MTMSSNNFNKIQRTLLYSFVSLLLATIISILWLWIFSENTTALGDPYYIGEILAPQRAFWPWLFTMLAIVVGTVLIAYLPLPTTGQTKNIVTSLTVVERIWGGAMVLVFVQGVGNYVLYIFTGYFSVVHVVVLNVALLTIIGIYYLRRLARSRK